MTSSPPPASPGTPPPRLAFLTFPLLVSTFSLAFSLLTLPFEGRQALLSSYEVWREMTHASGIAVPNPNEAQLQVMVWMMFALLCAIIVWLDSTRRALREGRQWGRISAIVIALFSLAFLPLGTVAGIFMLIGAFDRDVQRFARR